MAIIVGQTVKNGVYATVNIITIIDIDKLMEDNLQKGEGEIWSIIFIVFLIWGGIQVWNWIFPSQSDSSYSSPYSFSKSGADCVEPENPYDYGSGHYAGFEWGERGNYCSGNSNSFIEGCEEYYSQEEIYNDCINN